jgi:GNAT superfamily N-acetyltransferase
MSDSADAAGACIGDLLLIRPLGVDHFSCVRHLHATAMVADTTDALSEDEVNAFVGLVRSPDYFDMLLGEDIYGGWLDGELVATASWQASGDDGAAARIGSVFVAHRRLGIGRQMLAEVEARAHASGFSQLTCCATANAVPFFARLGYQVASRGRRAFSPSCTLPVTFLRKQLARA